MPGKRCPAADGARSGALRRIPKLALAVAAAGHRSLAARSVLWSGSDAPDFDPVLYRAWRRAPVWRVVAHAGYDAGANHRVARLDMGLPSVIKREGQDRARRGKIRHFHNARVRPKLSSEFSMEVALQISQTVRINGTEHRLPADHRVSLLDFLREHLHLSGTKMGCNQGACGACTVLVDGERVLSCLSLAVQCDGHSVTTIEGLPRDGMLHPLQQAFIEHDGFQCGYCTPGQICSAIGMSQEVKRGVPSHVTGDLAADAIALTHDELRERMSGNLCRCGAHTGIVDAIRDIYVEAAK